jgi:hypothetical protein
MYCKVYAANNPAVPAPIIRTSVMLVVLSLKLFESTLLILSLTFAFIQSSKSKLIDGTTTSYGLVSHNAKTIEIINDIGITRNSNRNHHNCKQYIHHPPALLNVLVNFDPECEYTCRDDVQRTRRLVSLRQQL